MPCLTGCTSPSSNGGKKPAACTTKKCPNPDPIADKSVKKALKKAFNDSNVGGKKPIEQGGWILRDPNTGELTVERLPAGKQAAISWSIQKDGKRNGKEIVGSFHTHPNVGPGWKQEPSDQDIKVVKKYPNTFGKDHYVISKDKVYHIDNTGKVTDKGKRSEILK